MGFSRETREFLSNVAGGSEKHGAAQDPWLEWTNPGVSGAVLEGPKGSGDTFSPKFAVLHPGYGVKRPR